MRPWMTRCAAPQRWAGRVRPGSGRVAAARPVAPAAKSPCWRDGRTREQSTHRRRAGDGSCAHHPQDPRPPTDEALERAGALDSPGSMTIRVLREDEWRQARDLRLRAVADAPEALASSVEEEALLGETEWRKRVAPTDTRVSFVEATEEDEFVGIGVGLLDETSMIASLRAMWVAPNRRRSATGTRLVEAVIDWARQRGAVRIELEVNQAARPASSLYRSCGFALTGQARALPFKPNVTALRMGRRI